MHIYLSLSHVPELSRLSSKQRRYVWRHCIHPLTLSGRGWLIRFAIILPLTALAIWLAKSFWHGAAVFAITAGLAAVFANYVANMILVARFRPEIRQFVAEHEKDIKAVA